MKNLVLIVLILITFVSTAIAEEFNEPFVVHYAAVQYSLKGDNGALDQLLDLGKKNYEAAAYITNFWWRRCIASCKTELEEAVRTSLDKWRRNNSDKKDPTEKDKEKMLKEVFDKIGPLIDSYIYDHWDEINETIMTRWAQAINGEG